MNQHNFNSELRLRISEVLFYVWDPIGVNDLPQARDEYDSYADAVWRMAIEKKSKNEISAYLLNVTTAMMEVEPRPDHDDNVAELIIEWFRYLAGKD